jgi:cell division protein FtsI/penicillin-binding protein 2
VCAIANDGFLMRPYIIREVHSPTGEVLLRHEPEVVSRPISAQTAATMRVLMGRVTESDGTGARAQVAGYTVAGKTGTAQKPIPGGYSDHENVASFVGFLPVEAPEIGVIVVVDNPQPIHTGGRVAAPLFSKIAGPAIRYLNVPGSDSMVAQAK